MPNKAEHREAAIREFELEWRKAPPADVRGFYRELDSSDTALLIELVLVDMEFRWSSEFTEQDSIGLRPDWHAYATAINLPVATVPAWALAEQHRIASSFDNSLSVDSWLSAYPGRLQELIPFVQQNAAYLRAEQGISSPTPDDKPAFDSRAPLPFEDYRLNQLVGAGGTGKVYRATQRSLNRTVAIKTLLKERQRETTAIEHFVQEAQIAASLQHQSIISIHGLGQFPGGGYFIAMDYVGPHNLATWLASGPPANRALSLFRNICSAIHFAHSKDVIHCDLKPTNILVDESDCPIVTDFGMASLRSTLPISSKGGTPAFMAPEQRVARPTVIGPPTDVFGLGRTLLEIANTLQLESSQYRQIFAVIDKATAVQPSDRYQTANELSARLEG